jgi:hypothetical protein
MENNDHLPTILTFGAIYAPFIVAALAGPAGGGVWKFLAFALCTVAIVGAFLGGVPGVIAWLLAFACAAAAHSAAKKAKSSDAILAELREQNRIARGDAAKPASSGMTLRDRLWSHGAEWPRH